MVHFAFKERKEEERKYPTFHPTIKIRNSRVYDPAVAFYDLSITFYPMALMSFAKAIEGWDIEEPEQSVIGGYWMEVRPSCYLIPFSSR